MNGKEELLSSLLNSKHQYAENILVKGVLFQFNGVFYPIKLFFQPNRNGNDKEQKEFNYGDLLLIKSFINIRELIELVDVLGDDVKLKLLFYNIKIPAGYFRNIEEDQQELSQKHRGYSSITDYERKYLKDTRSFPNSYLLQWPAKKYLFRFAPENDCVNSFHKQARKPLPLNEKLPALPEYYTAISWWLGNDLFNLNDWTLAFYAPDFRARIRSVKFGRDRIIVNVEEGISHLSDLGGKYYIEYENRSSETGDVNFPKGNVILIQDKVKRLYIVIFDKKKPSVGLDYRDYDWRYQHWDQETSDIEYEGENIEYWIANGENEEIEFKLEIETDNAKKEFLETICSFANSHGGRIFVGVDNNSNVKGLTEKQIERYQKMTQDLIRAWVEPQVQVKIEATEHKENKMIVVTIAKGGNPPYNYKDHGVYIRSGSTDRLATREELLSLTFEKH